MTNTSDLIASLSAQAKPTKKLRSPAYWAVRMLAVLAVYGAGTQIFLGLRPDLSQQLSRPFYACEVATLVLLLIASALAAVLAMYPDAYQKPRLLKLPYGLFILVFALNMVQLFMPLDERMVMPSPEAHAMECAICIAALALIPSAFIFALLRKGASVRQSQAGSFTVLAASAMGCLTLRLAEDNDSIMHLLQWHYVPTFLFAMIGVFLGKWLLKW